MCKSLQINKGSYGVLRINSHVNDSHYTTEFDLTTYKHTQCGGHHEHCKFTLTPKDAVEFANVLFAFRVPKEGFKLEQEHENKDELWLAKENSKIVLTIGSYLGGTVLLNRKQAKRLAGYVYYWIGQHFIGLKTIKIPKCIKKKLDINDKV